MKQFYKMDYETRVITIIMSLTILAIALFIMNNK